MSRRPPRCGGETGKAAYPGVQVAGEDFSPSILVELVAVTPDARFPRLAGFIGLPRQVNQLLEPDSQMRASSGCDTRALLGPDGEGHARGRRPAGSLHDFWHYRGDSALQGTDVGGPRLRSRAMRHLLRNPAVAREPSRRRPRRGPLPVRRNRPVQERFRIRQQTCPADYGPARRTVATPPRPSVPRSAEASHPGRRAGQSLSEEL